MFWKCNKIEKVNLIEIFYTYKTKMNNIVNTDLIQSPPVYNFYFADELNVSQ